MEKEIKIPETVKTNTKLKNFKESIQEHRQNLQNIKNSLR